MQEEIKRKIDIILTISVGGANEREIDKNLIICVEQGNEREIDKNLTMCKDRVNGESVLAEANFACKENGGALRLHHFIGFFIAKGNYIPNAFTYFVLCAISAITSSLTLHVNTSGKNTGKFGIIFSGKIN